MILGNSDSWDLKPDNSAFERFTVHQVNGFRPSPTWSKLYNVCENLSLMVKD
ncbi:MAG: hypothetical protein GF311_16955 [Candidatus Lokiarchaeota archaeon]|nr:hypothetical protein [Candidatus Lokiarchaeota archaeon]